MSADIECPHCGRLFRLYDEPPAGGGVGGVAEYQPNAGNPADFYHVGTGGATEEHPMQQRGDGDTTSAISCHPDTAEKAHSTESAPCDDAPKTL
jgi:hypothetical protein